MQEAFVNICGVPTHIMTWGKWIEESLDDVKEIAICITGNPGLPGFYTEFLGNVHRQLNCEMPVWVIGHLGHDDPPPQSIREVPPLVGNEAIFDLENQVKHKLNFIETYVPKNVKIHLMGHSIGAWMVLQLLKHDIIKTRIQKCYLLFPTVERMVESNNGWLFTNIVLPLYIVFGFLLTFFARLPVVIRIFCLHIYFWLFSIPNHFVGTALKYSKPSVMEKVIFLAKDEMEKVRGLDREIVKENIDKLKFFYGAKDGWVPVKYYEDLKRDIPNVDAILDKNNIEHAFVLRSSSKMGAIVAEWINENKL